MSRRKKDGPVITIYGQTVRALPTQYLEAMKEDLAQEVVYWRNQAAGASRKMAETEGELEKAEATVRNQVVEMARLRRYIAELESR